MNENSADKDTYLCHNESHKYVTELGGMVYVH